MNLTLRGRLKHLLAPLRYITELPLREVGDREAGQPANTGRIPPTVFQTWEDRLLGRSHRREIQRFRELNPGLKFEIWDRDKRDSYLQESWGGHPILEIYRRSRFGPMKADIFRYCLMAERGGFYFDISKGLSVPIHDLCGHSSDGLITFEPHGTSETCPISARGKLAYPGNLILQWGFGFSPGHPFPTRTIENICEAYPRFKGKVFANPKGAILELTGPIMFTRSVWDVLSEIDMPNTVQAGVDFNGKGIFALKGSKVRYLTAPSYAKAKDCVIVE